MGRRGLQTYRDKPLRGAALRKSRHSRWGLASERSELESDESFPSEGQQKPETASSLRNIHASG